MKAYKRKDFLELPAMIIYSKIEDNGYLMSGMFCKTSSIEFSNDWVEQDLISEIGFPNNETDSFEAFQHSLNLRDTFQDFETDLDCGCRDGLFEDNDIFVVWNKKDITKLRDYLNNVLEKIIDSEIKKF